MTETPNKSETTPANNNETWEEKQIIARSLRALLVEKFPLCFEPRRKPKKPLQIGIRAEIALRCPELDWGHLGIALFDYTCGPSYLRSFVPGAVRVDLDGHPVTEVSELDIRNAQARLRQLAVSIERRQEKRKLTQASATSSETIVSGEQ